MTLLPDPSDLGMETNILRKQTHGYIAQNPTDVVMNRATKVDDGAGGKRTSRAPRPVQTVRIIQSAEAQATVRLDQDGNNVRPDINMLMEWDGDVQRGDQFTWDGNLCQVVYITTLTYEKTAECITLGTVGS